MRPKRLRKKENCKLQFTVSILNPYILFSLIVPFKDDLHYQHNSAS